MAGPEKAQETEQLGIKRKRFTAEPVAAKLLDSALEDDAASDSGSSEQSEELLLDSFDQDIAEPLEAFNEAVTSTTAFLQPSEQLSLLARAAAKALYDYTSGSAIAHLPGDRLKAATASGVLTELHVEGFDAEQIWLQLDMASAQLVRRAKRLLKKAGTDPSLLTPETEEDLTDLLTGADLNADDEDGSDLSHEDDSAGEDELDQDHVDDLMDDDDGMGDDADEAAAGDDVATAKGNHKRRDDKELLPTEDKFLRLDDLESFLEDAERAAGENNDKESQDDADRLGRDLDEDESEAEDERDLILGGEDYENDSDADLDALLEDANRLVGRPASSGRKRAKTGRGRHVTRDNGSDEDKEGAEAQYMYDDFWGPSVNKQSSRSRIQGDLEEEASDLNLGDPDGLDEEDDLDLDAEDELSEDQDQDDPDDDGMGIFRQALDQSAHPADDDATPSGCLLDDDSARAVDKAAGLSKHERQQARMQERIAKLEAQNMAEKDWFMQGESAAARRPLNSALELDLDFERQIRAPPQATEEATASLEDLIKDRIANQVFDDLPRVLPPEPEKAKVALEMDDKKSHKGLGDIYEEEFVAATASGASTAVDKQDAVRQEAKNLMKELFGKLDALSHFHYAPKPVIEEMQVRADVPALAMEEVAPQVASEAAMRAPEEVYKAQQQGAPQAAEELSREERTRLRAKKKRAGKKRKQQEELQSSKPQSNIIGQKSEKALVAASGKKGKKGKASAQAPADKDSKISYSKSGSVFKRMQEQKEAAAAGLVPSLGHGDTDGPVRKKAAALKL
ncbi:hypothetical protein WJX79_002946 [Trebouxia sp. C0005]